MNSTLQLSFVFFISGALFLLFGLLNGEIEIGFVLILPFLIGSEIFTFLSFFSIFFYDNIINA